MRRIVTPIIIIALLAGGVSFVVSRTRGKGAAEKTQYKVTKVELGTVRKTVSATGTLQPWTFVDIKSKAGGRVDQLLVEVGDAVRKGQVLARIDPADTLLAVSTAQADIDAARARETQGGEQYQLQVRQSETAIQTAKEQLSSATASLNAARVRLKNAQQLSAVQPRQTTAAIRSAEASYRSAVKSRDQLKASQPQEYAQVKASRDQAEANNKNAQSNLERQRKLLDKGFVSQQVVDQAEASAGSAQAQLEAAQERLRSIKEEQAAALEGAQARVYQAQAQLENARSQTVDIQSRRNAVDEARAAVRQAEAQVAQARATLNQAYANRANNEIRRQDIASARAGTARAAATYKNARITLEQTTVRSPSDGVVLQKYVEQGTIITSGLSLSSTGTSILQIGDTTKMYVNVTVDETDISNVDVKQKVEVTVEAYPDVPFEGTVARIDPQAKVEQNVTTFNVRVEIDNSSPTFRLLKPGMNSTCEFIVGEKENVVAVPGDAVRTDDNGSFVEIAQGGVPAPPDPKSTTPADPNTKVDVTPRRVAVEVGLEGNDSVEITKGLKEGDTIVTETIEAATQAAGSPFATGGRGMGGGGRGGGGGGRR